MDPFAAHMLSAAVAALLRAPEAERPDTYVVSFLIYDEDDDPRLPTLTIGTNTNARVALVLDPPAGFVRPSPGWKPSDLQEARWNYAFWSQDQLAVIGDRQADPVGSRLRKRWLRELGIWYEDPITDEEWDRSVALGTRTTASFVRLVVVVARALHDQGVIGSVFGRSIPIVVHELEYYDLIAEQTLEANPPGVADDFARWVRSLGAD